MTTLTKGGVVGLEFDVAFHQCELDGEDTVGLARAGSQVFLEGESCHASFGGDSLDGRNGVVLVVHGIGCDEYLGTGLPAPVDTFGIDDESSCWTR